MYFEVAQQNCICVHSVFSCKNLAVSNCRIFISLACVSCFPLHVDTFDNIMANNATQANTNIFFMAATKDCFSWILMHYINDDWCSKRHHYFPNNVLRIALPSFLSTPAFDVGIPVSLANLCLACVMPSALFHEKESPGMPVLDFRVIINMLLELIF